MQVSLEGGPLELELQEVAIHQTWVLWIKLRSSAKTVHLVNPEPSLQHPFMRNRPITFSRDVFFNGFQY